MHINTQYCFLSLALRLTSDWLVSLDLALYRVAPNKKKKKKFLLSYDIIQKVLQEPRFLSINQVFSS